MPTTSRRIAGLKAPHRLPRRRAREGRPARCRTSTRSCARATRSMSAGFEADVWETPGHCADHVSYWFAADRALFAGDTLFTLGCGRVLEGQLRAICGRRCSASRRCRTRPTSIRGHDYVALERPLRARGRSGRTRPCKARAAEAERAKAEGRFLVPVDDRRGEGHEPVPARRRAGPRPRRRQGGRRRRSRCSGPARMEEPVLIR